MKTATTIVVSVAILATFGAHAQSVKSQKDRGDEFASMCRTAVKYQNDGFEAATEKLGKSAMESMADLVACYQYIRGFIEGHNMTADHGPGAKQFCLPSGVNQDQLAKIIVNAADDYPEITHHPRETLVEAALKQAFPCEGTP